MLRSMKGLLGVIMLMMAVSGPVSAGSMFDVEIEGGFVPNEFAYAQVGAALPLSGGFTVSVGVNHINELGEVRVGHDDISLAPYSISDDGKSAILVGLSDTTNENNAFIAGRHNKALVGRLGSEVGIKYIDGIDAIEVHLGLTMKMNEHVLVGLAVMDRDSHLSNNYDNHGVGLYTRASF